MQQVAEMYGRQPRGVDRPQCAKYPKQTKVRMIVVAYQDAAHAVIALFKQRLGDRSDLCIDASAEKAVGVGTATMGVSLEADGV
jgi:hypothetical protein